MLHAKVVYLLCNGSLNSTAIRPFGRCRLWYQLRFVPITAVRWTSRRKYIGSLANILFMAYYTSRNTITIASEGKILIQWESFIFVDGCETRVTMDLLSFPWQQQSIFNSVVKIGISLRVELLTGTGSANFVMQSLGKKNFCQNFLTQYIERFTNN